MHCNNPKVGHVLLENPKTGVRKISVGLSVSKKDVFFSNTYAQNKSGCTIIHETV